MDLRDGAAVARFCRAVQPEIVLHMAAQAQVCDGYCNPIGTFATNIMGSANLLEGLRGVAALRAVIVVTSDKVYANPEDGSPLCELAPLGGVDPYSASKGAAELVARSYAESFFRPSGIPVVTARGGNVLGGGDFSSDRLVPDLYRAACAGRAVELRYPDATRPWQHVLDCLSGYLSYAEYISAHGSADPPALNFGPISVETMTVAEVAQAFGKRLGNQLHWKHAAGNFPPERRSLALDSSLATKCLAWRPQLGVAATIDWTAKWYADYAGGKDALCLMQSQLARYAAKSRRDSW
jgi:CDP-glucose 4,6-dehydratase